jgi:nucleoside-diphosphate-sugar epimerase
MEGQIKAKSERKFLVTAATGATGRETAKLLRESGHAARALVHREDGYRRADTPGLCSRAQVDGWRRAPKESFNPQIFEALDIAPDPRTTPKGISHEY